MLDATLGVRGLPQSATGQTSLTHRKLTPPNSWVDITVPAPDRSLLSLLATQSLYAQMARAGRSCWHANSYSVHFCSCSNVQDTGPPIGLRLLST